MWCGWPYNSVVWNITFFWKSPEGWHLKQDRLVVRNNYVLLIKEELIGIVQSNPHRFVSSDKRNVEGILTISFNSKNLKKFIERQVYRLVWGTCKLRMVFFKFLFTFWLFLPYLNWNWSWPAIIRTALLWNLVSHGIVNIYQNNQRKESLFKAATIRHPAFFHQ